MIRIKILKFICQLFSLSYAIGLPMLLAKLFNLSGNFYYNFIVTTAFILFVIYNEIITGLCDELTVIEKELDIKNI